MLLQISSIPTNGSLDYIWWWGSVNETSSNLWSQGSDQRTITITNSTCIVLQEKNNNKHVWRCRITTHSQNLVGCWSIKSSLVLMAYYYYKSASPQCNRCIPSAMDCATKHIDIHVKMEPILVMHSKCTVVWCKHLLFRENKHQK